MLYGYFKVNEITSSMGYVDYPEIKGKLPFFSRGEMIIHSAFNQHIFNQKEKLPLNPTLEFKGYEYPYTQLLIDAIGWGSVNLKQELKLRVEFKEMILKPFQLAYLEQARENLAIYEYSFL